MQLKFEFMKLSEQIKVKRESLGLGRTEFANLLGMGCKGERTVRGWETGEHTPSQKKLDDIKRLEAKLKDIHSAAYFRYKKAVKPKFTFIDLFAGIGGIRIPYKILAESVFLVLSGISFHKRHI